MVRVHRLNAGLALRSFALVAIALAFAAGYELSAYRRGKTKVSIVSGVPPTDFAVPLPEGATRVTITDPQLDNAELASFVVERNANLVSGIPTHARNIAPRLPLSVEDISFFRRELTGEILNSDSQWQRSTRLRNWLSSGRFKMALPGLATRVPREAYLEMRQGKPVLCGNLAEIYVALCESAGLVARTVGLSLMVR